MIPMHWTYKTSFLWRCSAHSTKSSRTTGQAGFSLKVDKSAGTWHRQAQAIAGSNPWSVSNQKPINHIKSTDKSTATLSSSIKIQHDGFLQSLLPVLYHFIHKPDMPPPHNREEEMHANTLRKVSLNRKNRLGSGPSSEHAFVFPKRPIDPCHLLKIGRNKAGTLQSPASRSSSTSLCWWPSLSCAWCYMRASSTGSRESPDFLG